MSAPLHIVRTPVDRVALTTFATVTNTLDDDLGYALHLALRRRFGGDAPQPFRLVDTARGDGMLLGYVADPGPLTVTEPTSPPDPLGDWGEDAGEASTLLRRIFPAVFEAKAMPAVTQWRAGQRLAFEVLMRPVRRHSAKVEALREASGKRVNGRGTGGERDAFLCAVETLARGSHEVTRDAVYSAWLAERLNGAATLDHCEMTRFKRSRVVRRMSGSSRGAKGRGIEGPEALMEGVFTVDDPEALAALLARGIGRHVAFGYGMLLLRPAVR